MLAVVPTISCLGGYAGFSLVLEIFGTGNRQFGVGRTPTPASPHTPFDRRKKDLCFLSIQTWLLHRTSFKSVSIRRYGTKCRIAAQNTPRTVLARTRHRMTAKVSPVFSYNHTHIGKVLR